MTLAAKGSGGTTVNTGRRAANRCGRILKPCDGPYAELSELPSVVAAPNVSTERPTMRVTFHKLPDARYMSRAVRDDGVTVQLPGYDRVKDLPHDLVHLLVEREYMPTGGFWAGIAAGALFGGWVVGGRPRHDAAERSKEAQKAASDTNSEFLVIVVHDIASRRLDRDWGAADRLLRAEWRCSEAACRRLVAAEVRALCDEIRDAAVRWSAIAVGDGLTFDWPHRAERRVKRSGKRRRSIK